MAGAAAPIRLRRVAVPAALVAGYAASVLFSVFISRMGGPTSSIWTATGFLAAALILLRGRMRLTVAAACLAIQAATSLGAGDDWVRLTVGPLLNLVEAVIAAWLGVAYCGAAGRRLSLRKVTLLIVGAILPAAMLVALVGGAVNAISTGQNFVEGWLAWAIPSGLGMAMVTPALLLVARESQYKEFRRTPLEILGLIAGLCGFTFAVFYQSELPLLFAVFPALTIVAFRLGPPGAAIGGFFVAVIALTLTTLGHGPTMLSAVLDPVGRVRLAQVLVTAALFTTLATACVVADESRLRRLLVNRDRAARAARLRARAAERMAAEPMQR
ncbi:MAG TPA: MASE1 domain-containing protein, partial [Caulobacteraceae bacterium]|nr:MASE1 domain-containing protein [Caulobacteraceae bacterium]